MSRNNLFFLPALALLFSGCTAQNATISAQEPASAQIFAMDTYMELTAYGSEADLALSEISELLENLESTLSATQSTSEIYGLNHAEGAVTPVSDITISLISASRQLNLQTDGALDISIYPLSLAWGFPSGDYQVPDLAEIETLLPLVDQSLIQLDTDLSTVTLPAGMQIDLGAVAKGYAADCAASILQEHNVGHALLNLGSSTLALYGTKPDGSDWRVAVLDPENTASYAGVLSVSDCFVDTSGGYQRYFTDEAGAVYWHILDPDTGYPADSGLLSITIVSPSGLNGDGLSTACFVMGLEETIDYWQTRGEFEFVLITEDHEIYLSQGLADSFTPLYDYEEAVITVVRYED